MRYYFVYDSQFIKDLNTICHKYYCVLSNPLGRQRRRGKSNILANVVIVE